MNDETYKRIEDGFIQLDSKLNSIEVKGESVMLLFTSRALLKDIFEFIKENKIEKKELSEEDLNKEV